MSRRKRIAFVSLLMLLAIAASAQSPGLRALTSAADPKPAPSIPVVLEWTPPALASLGERAVVKNSFVFDRTMLAVAAGLLPQSETGARQSIRKLDGVAVHLYRFQDEGDIDPDQLNQVRQAYHARGWQHLVSPRDTHAPDKGDKDAGDRAAGDKTAGGNAAGDKGALLQKGKTDLWLAFDGMEIRGGTLLVVTPRSVSLITFAGDLNPVDLLHLRGHFGIPNFSGDKFDEVH